MKSPSDRNRRREDSAFSTRPSLTSTSRKQSRNDANPRSSDASSHPHPRMHPRWFGLEAPHNPDPATRYVPLKGKLVWTYALMWISLFLMFASCIVGGGITYLKNNPMLGPPASALLKMGALEAGHVRDGEWWRLFFAPFLHAGWFHIVMNFILWYKLGIMVEPDWGFWRMMFVYMVAALSGNLMSATLDPFSISVGASGGIFGIMGGCVPYVVEYWHTVPQPKCIMWIVLGTLIVGLACGFMPYVDNYAHIGGAIGGLLCGFMTITKIEMGTPAPPKEDLSYMRSRSNISRLNSRNSSVFQELARSVSEKHLSQSESALGGNSAFDPLNSANSANSGAFNVDAPNSSNSSNASNAPNNASSNMAAGNFEQSMENAAMDDNVETPVNNFEQDADPEVAQGSYSKVKHAARILENSSPVTRGENRQDFGSREKPTFQSEGSHRSSPAAMNQSLNHTYSVSVSQDERIFGNEVYENQIFENADPYGLDLEESRYNAMSNVLLDSVPDSDNSSFPRRSNSMQLNQDNNSDNEGFSLGKERRAVQSLTRAQATAPRISSRSLASDPRQKKATKLPPRSKSTKSSDLNESTLATERAQRYATDNEKQRSATSSTSFSRGISVDYFRQPVKFPPTDMQKDMQKDRHLFVQDPVTASAPGEGAGSGTDDNGPLKPALRKATLIDPLATQRTVGFRSATLSHGNLSPDPGSPELAAQRAAAVERQEGGGSWKDKILGFFTSPKWGYRPRERAIRPKIPTRTTFRSTHRFDVDDSFDWKSKKVWAVRGGASLLLFIFWFPLFYFLLICPTCYSPPGQLVGSHRPSPKRALTSASASKMTSTNFELPTPPEDGLFDAPSNQLLGELEESISTEASIEEVDEAEMMFALVSSTRRVKLPANTPIRF